MNSKVELHDPDHRYRPPRFQHDCDCCLYQGRTIHEDIYVCAQGGFMPTIVARYGSLGPEYTSGLVVDLGSGMHLEWTRPGLERITGGEGKMELPSTMDEVVISEINRAAYRVDTAAARESIVGQIRQRLGELDALGIPYRPLGPDGIRFLLAENLRD